MTLDEKPWWYLTSPVWSESGTTPSNSSNSSLGSLPRMFTRTLSRPRCAMPMTASTQPWVPSRCNASCSNGNQAFGAFQAEPLCSPDNVREGVSRGPSAAVSRSRMTSFESLSRSSAACPDSKPLPHPDLFLLVGDVGVLGPDRAAIGGFQRDDDVAQRRLAAGEELCRTRLKYGVEIGLGQVVVAEFEVPARVSRRQIPSGSSSALRWPRLR